MNHQIIAEPERVPIRKLFKCKPEHYNKQLSKVLDYTTELMSDDVIESKAENVGTVIYFQGDDNVPHLAKYFDEVTIPLGQGIVAQIEAVGATTNEYIEIFPVNEVSTEELNIDRSNL